MGQVGQLVRGELFQVDDLHCLKSQCACTDVHLFLAPIPADSELFQPIKAEHEVQVILDLQSRKWHVEEEDEELGIPAPELIAALRKTHNVVRIYKKRRRTLRILYRNHRKRIAKTEIAEEGGVGDSRRQVGRNDPCPCGSGKKYKKCCLGKDS